MNIEFVFAFIFFHLTIDGGGALACMRSRNELLRQTPSLLISDIVAGDPGTE